MKVVLAYSSKKGLQKEYLCAFSRKPGAVKDAPADCFAEGDSPETIDAAIKALRECGHEVSGLEADEKARHHLEKLLPDMVFNIAEGLFGDFRESCIPMHCERLGIRYTGSGPLSLGICLNKARCKEILTYHGIPNPKFKTFRQGDPIDLKGFSFPVIVKPVAEGSGKGIFDKSVADNAKSAKKLILEGVGRYSQPMIVEEFLEGDEFTVAMIGNGDSLEVLPIVALNFGELPKGARKIYSYEAKWVWDTPEKPLEMFQCPAKLPVRTAKCIESLVKVAFRALELRDWCRMDVRMDSNGIPHIIEVNPLPGILPNPEDNSCFPKAARTAGYSYSQMLGKVIEAAERRQS